MLSFISICIAALAACTLTHASTISQMSAIADVGFTWFGTISNGTTIHLNGTLDSVLAQVYAIDPNYKAAPANVTTEKRATIGSASCNPAGVGQTAADGILTLASELALLGGTCVLSGGYHTHSEWSSSGGCINWINIGPPPISGPPGSTLSGCSDLADIISDAVHQCTSSNTTALVSVSNHEGSAWNITGGLC